MSEARTFSPFFGHGRNALLFDLSITEIMFPPKSEEDLEACVMMIPRLAYPRMMLQNIRGERI